MENQVCNDCTPARGVRFFSCFHCGKKSNNYANGVNICLECCKKENRCTICGRKQNKD